MDTGRGTFEPVNEGTIKALREHEEAELRRLRGTLADKAVQAAAVRDLPRVFTVGQLVELNGSRFRVAKIAKRRLILKLLADEKP